MNNHDRGFSNKMDIHTDAIGRRTAVQIDFEFISNDPIENLDNLE